MLFLSCGLRVSELVSLNLTDVYEDHVRVLGKGNKERVVYFGEGCREAIDDYLMVRNDEKVPEKDKKALFISQKNCRFGVRGVQLVSHGVIEVHQIGISVESDPCDPHEASAPSPALHHVASAGGEAGGDDVIDL